MNELGGLGCSGDVIKTLEILESLNLPNATNPSIYNAEDSVMKVHVRLTRLVSCCKILDIRIATTNEWYSNANLLDVENTTASDQRFLQSRISTEKFMENDEDGCNLESTTNLNTRPQHALGWGRIMVDLCTLAPWILYT